MRLRRGFLFGLFCLLLPLPLSQAAFALPFAPVVNYAFGPNIDVELGDFNGDGITDIAALNAGTFGVNSTVTVRLGLGHGTFGPAQTSQISTGGLNALDLAVGDFNGDGRSDVVATQQFGQNGFVVALSLGNGTFSPPTLGSGLVRPSGITVADFNHDGKLDVATATGGNCCAGATISLGNGNGTFQPPVTYSLGLKSGGRSVTAGDLNHDGKPDLVGTSAFGQGGAGISAILGNGNGTFGPPQVVASPIGIPGSVALGFFNGDVFLDIAVTLSAPDGVGVFLGAGNGTFGPEAVYSAGAGPTDVVVGDLTGDGRADLAVSNSGSANVSILLGIGTGLFFPVFSVAVGAPASSLALGNLNGVGLADLAVSASPSVAVLLNIP